ncbi:MAG: type VI secretion system tube protein Hcp, partial [Alphaproteobacteria bacterium]
RDLSSEPNRASGLPTGKRRHKPITILKRVDRASPMLRRAHATRRPLPRVVITGRNSSGAKVKWVIEKVHVTAYSVSGSGASATEELTIVFEYIQQTPS